MFWETVLLAQREIRRNVLRSSLTILGIVIGVAAVITLVTLGSGATRQVADQIGSLGSNMLQLRPGQGFRGPGGASSASDPFKQDDVEAIIRDISNLAAVAPVSSAATQAIVETKTGPLPLPAATMATSRYAIGPCRKDASSARETCVPGEPCAFSAPR